MNRNIDSERTRLGLAWFADAGLAGFAALIGPSLLYTFGLASADRLLYPATSVAVAGYMYYKRSPWYVGFCVWLFCTTPLIRRLTDEQSGFDPSNPILLAPYLACGFTVFSLLRLSPRFARPATPFLIVLLCVGYGFVLAVLQGRVVSGMVDVMKWGAGPLFAIYLLTHVEQRLELHRASAISFLIATPAMAAYGVAQFIAPPAWDADWAVAMINLGMDSIGRPLPFELRVFSSMNSPGSFGIVMTTAILIGLQQRRLWLAIPAVMAMVVGLLLSQYRAIWAGTLLGTICLLIFGKGKTKVRVLLTAASILLVTWSVTILPEIQQAIYNRIRTINELDADASGQDRLRQYEQFLSDTGNDLVFGEGLAISGASRRLDNRHSNVIDSGIIEGFSAFGIVGGTIFFAGIFWAVGLMFTKEAGRCQNMPLYRAIAVATFCQLPFGSVHVGESGFGAWLFVGLATAAVVAQRDTDHPYSLRFPGMRITKMEITDKAGWSAGRPD